MTGNMWSQFSTDPNVEAEGVWLDYGDFRVKIRYAGESNKKYTRALESRTRPFRRQIANGTFSDDRSKDIFCDVYAEAVVVDWNVAEDDDAAIGETIWKRGIHGKDGGILPYTKDNVKMVLKALPPLFNDIRQSAESIALFRADEMEEDGKN